MNTLRSFFSRTEEEKESTTFSNVNKHPVYDNILRGYNQSIFQEFGNFLETNSLK